MRGHQPVWVAPLGPGRLLSVVEDALVTCQHAVENRLVGAP
ncbi:hypothetical protein [Streptomyces californicus]|nr:hypothetical protein [Streptomyces californicus]MDW4912600.1 hypothetical protein [Streptomyces californicus]